MIADIVPRPAIEPALAHPRDVIGRQIVAEPVALVGRAPEIAGLRLDGEADAVAQAGGEAAPIAAAGIENENVGAAILIAPARAEPMRRLPTTKLVRTFPRHALCDVRGRADRDEHALAVRREHDVARRMAAIGKTRNDLLRRAARLEVAAAIGKAQHRGGGGDIEKLRVGAGRVEGEAEGCVEIVGENRAACRRRRAVRRAQYADPIAAGLGDEDVAVGGDPNDARRVQPAREKLHGEAGWHFERGTGRCRDDAGRIARRPAGIGCRHVFGRDTTPDAGPVAAPVAVGLLAAEDRGCAGLQAAPLCRRVRGRCDCGKKEQCDDHDAHSGALSCGCATTR